MINLDMDVVVGHEQDDFEELEMNSGIKVFTGASDLTQITASTILDISVPKKSTSIHGLRNMFKHTFDGSFGQQFNLRIEDPNKINRFNDIGKSVFFDVMSYYISKGMGIDHNLANQDAIDLVEGLKPLERSLLIRIQDPIQNMHRTVEKQGYNVLLRRRTPHRKFVVAKMNVATLHNINVEHESPQPVQEDVIITRFNMLTGTGRLLLDRKSDSIAFRHALNWDHVLQSQKNKFSRNLDVNNRGGRDAFIPITISANELKDHIGELKTYIIREVL
ncbi:hypothetical protein [Yersinia mollaretii]|uniref:hypothetical protein n=1 Tax=Yersinia mollaretii TaxID=33060 RepID=UPI0005E9EA41|nr:hypothetical protein [Yersinia mollaretii]ELI7977958.1 hypothetical protein [Yersinia enterocolitica]CQD42256.1 Uncharacterised protein [Yersinia mollaretii]